jgi:Lipocalin-like domain
VRGRKIIGAAVAAVFGAALLGGGVFAQQKSLKDQLVGTWMLSAVTAERADGSKAEPFGADPKGIIIFTADGYFSLLQSRPDLPKIAANDRAKATPEEATVVVAGSIAYYGMYSVNEADKTIAVKIEQSTYTNVMGGPEQKRIITSLTADEMKFTNPRTPAGVTLLTAWKRAAAR